MGIKALAKDTAIYGLSSIVGRFLNWCLVPLYTILFPATEYGVVTYVYSIVALALIVLTYGMETGFFRFSNHERYRDEQEVYSTSLISLGTSSALFITLILVFLSPISDAMQCRGHESYVAMMAIAVGVDAFTAIPYCQLRQQRRAWRFAGIRLTNIAVNIGLNIFFLIICPWLWENAPGWIAWFYVTDFGIGYIFLANLISSCLTLVMMLPDMKVKWKFNPMLWREMLRYSYPLLILGIAGIMNQTIDKILFPILFPDKATAMDQLGIYGANYKIAIVMVMFIQAFRFAYEPYIFARSRDKGEDRLQSYRDAMRWFVIFAMVIFLGVMFYMDILRHFIASSYFGGLKVVPVIMMAEFFFGVFFNLSLWYKLTDKTLWGMWLSLFGLAVTVTMNVVLVPKFGYMGCAWAALSCYGLMMAASYFLGRWKYPIGYNVPRLGAYFLGAVALYLLSQWLAIPDHPYINMAIRTPFLLAYIAIAVRWETGSWLPKRLH